MAEANKALRTIGGKGIWAAYGRALPLLKAPIILAYQRYLCVSRARKVFGVLFTNVARKWVRSRKDENIGIAAHSDA